MTLLVILAFLIVVAGVAATIGEWRGVPVRLPRVGVTSAHWQGWYDRAGRTTRILLAVSIPLGLAVWLATGWFPVVFLLPALIAGVPALLAPPKSAASIEKLDALAEWTRNLAGVLGSAGIQQSIRVTQRSAPAPIHDDVTRLVDRLDAQIPLPTALDEFADDLDDATGDKIVASLKLAANTRGPGLVDVLIATADSVSEEVNVRRQIEAERARPRTIARWVTIIMLVMAGFLATRSEYVQPYTESLGQLILLTLAIGYAGCLIWMRRMTEGTPPPRFMGNNVSGAPR
jgi:tight adherence protein B